MRKMLLTLVILLVMSTSCLAANWEWIGSDADTGLFFDTSTITFEKHKQTINRDKVYVWVRIVYDKEYARKQGNENVSYVVSKSCIDFANNKISSGKSYLYSENGRLIDTTPPMKAEDIIPNSKGEIIAEAVDKYIRNRTEEIEQRTRNAH